MRERVIADTPTVWRWANHLAPIITGLGLAVAAVYAVARPEKLIHELTDASNTWMLLPLCGIWYIELHLAVTVWVCDEEHLVFKGLFRKWTISPVSVSRVIVLRPFAHLALVRHRDGFILIPTKMIGADALVAWISSQQRRDGIRLSAVSSGAGPET